MELLCSSNNQDENSVDSATEPVNENNGNVAGGGGVGGSLCNNSAAIVHNNLPQGPHSGNSSVGDRDHDDRDSAISPYLTATESKLFATAGGFNFTMAALAADPNALGSEYLLTSIQ